MKPKIYLAGPISGLSYKEATNWRDYVTPKLTDVFHVLTPLRGKEYLRDETALAAQGYSKKPLSTAKAITNRDRNDVKNSAVVLMNLLGAKIVSIGTMIELAWADRFEVPVVLVMEPEERPSVPFFWRSWLAALIDGEGNVRVTKSKPHRLQNPIYQASITVAQKRPEMCRQAHEITKAGTFRGPDKRGYYTWRVVGQEAASVCRDIYSNLMLKKTHAAAVLELQRTLLGRTNYPHKGEVGFRPRTNEELNLLEALYQRFRAVQDASYCHDCIIPAFETPEAATSNVHDHGMVQELAAFRVADLDLGIDIARYVIGASPRAMLPRLPTTSLFPPDVFNPKNWER